MPFGDEPIFPPGFPEDYKQQIIEHQKRQDAHTQDNTHGVRMLLDELNADELKALDLILVAVIAHPKYNGAYFRGQITSMLHVKYDVCPCGIEHDPTKALQLPEITRPGSPVQPNDEGVWMGRPIEDTELPDAYDTAPPELTTQTPDEGEQPWEPGIKDGPEEYDKNMDLYRLDEGVDGKVYCRDCGVAYQSLEDRMVKPPGVRGCESCQQKERWG